MNDGKETAKKIQDFLRAQKASWLIPLLMLGALAIYLFLTKSNKLPFIYSQF